jgi:hypothetical protein
MYGFRSRFLVEQATSRCRHVSYLCANKRLSGESRPVRRAAIADLMDVYIVNNASRNFDRRPPSLMQYGRAASISINDERTDEQMNE